MLHPSYCLFLLNFIGGKVEDRLAKSKKRLDSERRDCLKREDNAGYSRCVSELMQLKDQTFMQMIKDVIGYLGIEEKFFSNNIESYAS